MRPSRLVGVAAALVPFVVLAQVEIGIAPDRGATVLGRVCVDFDHDGRCGPADLAIAGARVIGEGGEVARADPGGRFHLLDLAGRMLGRDRSAYGGHVIVAEGLGARRAFELAPGGAAEVDLAVPAPREMAMPSISAGVGVVGRPPSRAPDRRLRWPLVGRTTPGSTVTIDNTSVTAAQDGAFAVDVLLAPGENRFTGWVTSPSIRADAGTGRGEEGPPSSAIALFAWTVQLVLRARGGDLVIPGSPVLLGSFAFVPASGGGALLIGEARPGLRLRAGGLVAGAGRVAAFLPGGGALELLDGSGGVVGTATIPLAPASGLAAAAALADVELSIGRAGVLVTGRGAAAARGRLGPMSYEAGVDLDDRDKRLSDLARPRDALAVEHALDPVRTFLTTGDEGAADDRNPGRGRAWARLAADGARLDLGSARAGLTGGELGRYDRALFGAKLAAERQMGPLRLEGSAFGATLRRDAGGNAPPSAAHDVLRAIGGAALWLAHGEIVPGSEGIRIELRDPLTGRAVWNRALVRTVDYEIDWTSGRIVLAAPLASVAPPAVVETGNPFAAQTVLVIADYLYAATGSAAEDLHGGRIGAQLGPLAVSAKAAEEERPGDSYRLLGAAAELDLGPVLRVRAEAARTRGLLFSRGGEEGFARSEDGGLIFAPPAASAREADALHLEANGGLGPFRLQGWWRDRERGYSDGEFLEAISAREQGAQVGIVEGRTSGVLRWAERSGGDPRDPAGLARLDVNHVVARAAWQGERLGLVLEGVNLSRTGDTPSAEETSAGARASWVVDKGLTVDAAHHQKLWVTGAGIDPTFTSVGASVARGSSSLSVRGGWGPELGPRLIVSGARLAPGEAVYGTFGADPDAPDVLGGSASALGVRQRVGNTELFTEEQFERDVFGLRQARVLGASVSPLAGMVVSVSGEKGQRLRLDGSLADRSAAAAAASIVRGPVRVAARGELRDEGGDAQAAAGGSAEWILAPGASLGARVSWTHGTSAGVEGLGFEASVGGAWRGERLGVLANGARIVERRPGEARRDGVLAHLAVTKDAAARVELGLGAAVAVQEVDGARSDRLSGSVRARVRITGPLDGAVEYARRAPLTGALDALDAVRAEAGLSSRESRIAVGYNLFGFGGDGLSPAADTSRFYVRAQLAY